MYKTAGLVASNVYPDQTPHSAASNLGVYCLPRHLNPTTWSKCGKAWYIKMGKIWLLKHIKNAMRTLRILTVYAALVFFIVLEYLFGITRNYTQLLMDGKVNTQGMQNDAWRNTQREYRKYFSRRDFEIFSCFSKKVGFGNLWRQVAWHVIAYFQEKWSEKYFQFVVCWIFPHIVKALILCWWNHFEYYVIFFSSFFTKRDDISFQIMRQFCCCLCLLIIPSRDILEDYKYGFPISILHMILSVTYVTCESRDNENWLDIIKNWRFINVLKVNKF